MQPDKRMPARSLIGLNAANFLQAEMVGVILPILNVFLKQANWRYGAIGLATAVAGLKTLLFQTPAEWLVAHRPRTPDGRRHRADRQTRRTRMSEPKTPACDNNHFPWPSRPKQEPRG